MVNSLIACDDEDKTLGGFFLECATNAKLIFDLIPFPVTELYSKQLNDLSISLKVTPINKENFLFAAYSHGGDDCLVVSAADPYISPKHNHNIFTNAFFYTFACSCGKLLGKVLIDNGAKLFWGYDEDIFVIISHQQVFAECANEGLKIISNGKSVSEAILAVNEKYNEHIDGTYKFDMVIASTLMDNRDALIVMTADNTDFDDLRLYN